MSCNTQHISGYNLREIIGPETEGIMVYGIGGCFYEKVYAVAGTNFQGDSTSLTGTHASILKPLKKVYNYFVGYKSYYLRGLDDITLLPKIKYNYSSDGIEASRGCKAGVTNITIYNTIQEEQGKSTVPIIFCVKGKNFNSSKACDWEVNKKTVLSKDSTFNEKITIKEVRRVGKLCFDEEIDPRVRRAAQKNVFFVEVTEHRDTAIDLGINIHHYTYTLAKIPPPWGTTQKSIAAFKQGLKGRAAEKETNPLDRAMRRISGLDSSTTSTILSQERMILIKLIAQTKAEELTVAENEDFERAFDWDTVLNSNRTFTCFAGGVPKTLKQAYAERIEAHIETPSFREQVNTLVQDTLDKRGRIGEATLIQEESVDLSSFERKPLPLHQVDLSTIPTTVSSTPSESSRRSRENRCNFLRNNCFVSCFKSYDHIVESCCEAWNGFTSTAGAIRQVCSREWVKTKSYF